MAHVTVNNTSIQTKTAGDVGLSARIGKAVELSFPVQIEFSRRGQSDSAIIFCTASPSEVVLPLPGGGGSFPVGRTGSAPIVIIQVSDSNATSIVVFLDLTHEQLVDLEKHRAGDDLNLDLKLDFRAWTGNLSGQVQEPLRFRVPASDWVKRLGSVGLFRSVQMSVPLTGAVDVTTHAHLQNELRRAERLFQQADYSECVAVIRDVWDPIIKELSPDGRWDPIIDKAFPNDTGDKLKKYAKALRDLVNKGHHRNEPNDPNAPLFEFGPHEAEFVMVSAMSFLRLLGNVRR